MSRIHFLLTELSALSLLCALTFTAPAGVFAQSWSYGYGQSTRGLDHPTYGYGQPGESAATDLDYLDDISADGIFNWPVEKFPLKVYIERGDNVPGYRPNYPNILRAAFDEWARASRNRLSWVEVGNRAAADVVCQFTAQAPERDEGTEAGRTKTYTRFDTATNHGTIYKATVGLATRLPDREMSDEEITKTFLHEVGHAFGLAGHSPRRTDIMFARVSPSMPPRLSQHDRATILRLYDGYQQAQPVAAQRGPVAAPDRG